MSRYLLSTADQGTEEWKLARMGKATGSRAGAIVATIKTGEAAARRDYRVQLVMERLTGSPAEDGFTSKEMQWGTEQEPYARMAYESKTGELVREAGFAYLPDVPAGCSVDGFLEGNGFVECKCPKSATHIEYLQRSRVPPDYLPQVTHNLWVTGCDFVDFVSFDPRMPDYLQFFTVRLTRAEVDIAAYEAKVLAFLREVDDLERDLRARSPLARAA